LKTASYRTHDPEGNVRDPVRNDIFSYDALGNRQGSNYVASRGTMAFTRKDNGLNQYSGWWPYSVTNYDDDLGTPWGNPGLANGVLMQEGWITGSYNALNQPVGMWSPAYAGTGNWMWFGHDPLGRCVKRWIAPSSGTPASNPATYYYYDGWSLVQEGSSSSNAQRLYVHGGRVDEMVAQITPGNGWQRYFQYDARGHCTLQTDAFGDIVEQYDYDAFGFPYFYDRWGNNIASSPWGNRFLFTGREWISDLRTYDYRNRMYQPELGRFLQPDPKQFEAGDYNLYRYCHNDPVNKSDPLGLIDWAPFPRGTWEYTDTRLFPDPPNRFDMGAHGIVVNGKDHIERIGDGAGKTWTPKQLYDTVKNDPTFQKSETVRMYICEAGRGGKDSFAQKFAKISGKAVEAGAGDLDAAKYTGGKPHFSKPDDMKFNLFKPSTWKLGFRRFDP
jgi:RHS repeat-associated protein